MYQIVKMKSVFEKYLSNTPKYTNQIQIQIFHLVGFQIQIQIYAYLNKKYKYVFLTPALPFGDQAGWGLRNHQIVTGVTSDVGVPSTHLVHKWVLDYLCNPHGAPY